MARLEAPVMTSPPGIEWITDPDSFDALAGPWERLSEGQATPFASYAWFSSWWHAFGGALALRIVACWDGEELVAVLPLYAHGNRLLAMANVHTPVFDPPYRDQESLDRAVDAALGSGWADLRVPALPATPVLSSLVRASKQAGRLSLVEAQHASPVVATGSSLDEYKQARKSELRPIERKRRKLMREHEASFTLVEPPHDLVDELERGFALEASGWKGRGGTAIESDAQTKAFYTALAVAGQERGQVRLSTLAIDGRLAAFDLCLLHRSSLYLVKTAYDEALSRLAPGLVLRLAVVERCHELGLEAHDLGGDRSDWKLKFSTGQREHHLFGAYRKQPVPALRYAYRRLARPVLRSAYRGAARARRNR